MRIMQNMKFKITHLKKLKIMSEDKLFHIIIKLKKILLIDLMKQNLQKLTLKDCLNISKKYY